MVQVYSEYNADLLTPAQIEELHGALTKDIAAMAETDGEADAQPEVEAG